MRRTLLIVFSSYILTTPILLGATPNLTGTETAGTSATALLTQLSTAFSGGTAVHQVQLTGTASWHAGSLNDTGSATLSASTTGSSQVQLSLSSGTRTESQSGQGSNLDCTWAGEDGIPHTIDAGNCWRPVIWFLPPLSLQPSLLSSSLGALDLGTGTVGFGTGAYRHLQSELVLPDLTTAFASIIMRRSTADLGLDPATRLPAVLAYTIYPDNGATIPIAIEVHYSNYQAVNGVQIPFTIERYVNGSLQLELAVTSAQVN